MTPLNKEQKEAVNAINGPVKVLAGAGTGKTATLTYRVKHMLDEGIEPDSILMLTFTNKAANEMKNRIETMVGEPANFITAMTFHSFCAMHLRKYLAVLKNEKIKELMDVVSSKYVMSLAKILDVGSKYTIIDSSDVESIISICKEDFLEKNDKEGALYDLTKFPISKKIIAVHSCSVNSDISIEDAIEKFNLNSYGEEIIDIVDKFSNYKTEHSMLDYDDLLYGLYLLLLYDKDYRKYMDDKYKYISCDEYQDTNVIQNKILKLLSKDNKNLAVVGDDNQSIYKFRFANIENILDFGNEYTDCKSIILNQNYRSTQRILDLVNEVMEYSIEGLRKNLKSDIDGEMPKLIKVPNQYNESILIADDIESRQYNGENLNSMAVIMRSARQSFILEVELAKRGIPFKKYGGKRFIEKPLIKDILSFLRLSVNLKDEIALFRVLQLYPKIGTKTAKRISSHIVKNGIENIEKTFNSENIKSSVLEIQRMFQNIQEKQLTQLLEFLIKKYYMELKQNQIILSKKNLNKKNEELARLQTRIQDAETLIDMAENYKDAESFLSALVLDAAVEDTAKNCLNLTTIHSAKGLEYDTVYIMDVVDGATPSCREGDKDDPEELRCFYVAMTRAKKNLYLVAPKYYNGKPVVLSHFVCKDSIIKKLVQIDLSSF